MAEPIPLWRRTLGRLDETVTPAADALVRSEAFAVAAGLANRAQREVHQRVERTSRRAWHFLNLPAGSDVNRVLTQIASLEREVRDLQKRLADVADVEVQAPATTTNGSRPHRPARPRPA